MIGSFLLVMGVMQCTPAVSYTAFNLACLFYAIHRVKTFMMPVLFVNTLALSASFYATLLIEPTFFSRLSIAYNYSRNMLILGDIVVHAIPAVAMLLSLYVHDDMWKQLAIANPGMFAFAPFFSILLNLFWAVMQPRHFVLDNVYTSLSMKQWIMSWHMCIFAHLSFGFLLSYRYIFRSNDIVL